MNERRQLPSIERLVAAIQPLTTAPRAVCVAKARLLVADWRQHPAQMPASFDAMCQQLHDAVTQVVAPSLRRVINATGVLLQTNLGRAPLSAAAVTALRDAAGAVNIEYDIAHGSRGDRHRHLRSVIQQSTGAESAIVVNNNAAAVLLTLMALAQGREVIVSRGHAVEIGGGFRIPDILRQSGATLVEVGTTNRTYARDYADAITPQTALMLRVHQSNFRMQGFVHEPSLAELVAVAQQHQVLLVDNLGSGSLIDVAPFGLNPEPRIQDSLAAGVDVVCFSGDKLIGGPQAGIVAGRQRIIDTIARHPLMRALRPDKLTIAALHATLQSYVNETAFTDIPIWQMITATPEHIAHRAQALAATLPAPWHIRATHSTIGGGALPGETLSSWAVVCPHTHPDALAAMFRQHDPAIIGRIADDALWFDMRTIAPCDDSVVATAIHALTRASG